MTTLTIIALDPGGTSGWATYRALRMIDPNTNEYEYFDEEWNGGQLGPEPHHKELDFLLGIEHTEDYTIVCESFDYRNASPAGLNLMSRDYIGVVNRFAQERNVPVVMQSASMGKVTKKSFVRKENLERLGLWVKGGASKWNHMMDAYGHLLQYLIRNDIRREYLLQKGWGSN